MLKLLLCSLLLLPGASAQTTRLSLREAVSQALASHSLLAEGAERVAAAEALRSQAALRPNRRLIPQTENLRAHGPGRQEIAIRAEADEVPVFARNGSIVPLAPEDAGRPFELHYFPKLAAELFLWEQARRDFSQLHAAPALDFMRLESEALITREYEWIVHNVERVKQVTCNGLVLEESAAAVLKPGTWRYDDERRNLHVRVLAAAHGDEIVNVRF